MTSTNPKELTIAEAASEEGVNPKTVWKWIRKGLQGSSPDDPRIKLKARKRGKDWVIHPADLATFSERLTAASLGETVPTA